jgi:hypothetical protein
MEQVAEHAHDACCGQTDGPAEKPRMLTCDDVAWLKHVLERFEEAVRRDGPSISRGVKAAKMAAVLEIAELMGCAFEDDAAKHNVISEFPEIYQGARAGEPKRKQG